MTDPVAVQAEPLRSDNPVPELVAGLEQLADPLAHARLAAIVDSSFDAIISKDLNSIIKTWNPAAARLFGYSAEEAVGRSITMLIPDHLIQEEDEIIGRIKRGDRVESYETVRRRKDGTPVYISITVSPIKDRHGVIVGASKVARDITAARENERRIRLLLREINHRVKNQFAVINSIIRETSKSTTDPAEFEVTVRNRILALARSHDLLVSTDWSGASLSELLLHQLAPYGLEERISVEGPPILLSPIAVQNLGMAFHELGTNSAKYGALSRDGGTIAVTWSTQGGDTEPSQFDLRWTETVPGLTGEARQGERRGFGSVVLLRVAPQSLGGTASLDRSSGQIVWHLHCPTANILPSHTEEL